MFYLFLIAVVLIVILMVYGRFRVLAEGSISRYEWHGRVRLRAPLRLFGIGWSVVPGSSVIDNIRLFGIPMTVKIPVKSAVSPQKRAGQQKKSFLSDLNEKLERIRTLNKSIKKLNRIISIQSFDIHGEIRLWDPAMSGMIYGLIQWLRSLTDIPLNVQLKTGFFPGESHASGCLVFEFRLIHIIHLMIQERHFRIKQGGA